MAANIDTLFYTSREVPWHKMGKKVDTAPSSSEAIIAAGLDWNVEQREMYLANGDKVPDAYANVRDKDNKVLGIVGNRYSIVQNVEAFSFTDNLIGEGCVYETAGSLKDGKQIWLLAHLPEAVQIAGDDVMPYLCFTNTHDGSGAVKVFATPIRVVCNNTLNQALNTAKRTWSARHTGSIDSKLREATETLELTNKYMTELKKESEALALKSLDKDKLLKFIEALIPVEEDMSARQIANLNDLRNDIYYRYMKAPDLVDRENTYLKFLHAVSDTATHREPNRMTARYAETHFMDMVSGNNLIDKAFAIVKAA